jgi:pentatricopeptide repeat protein
MTAAQKCYEEYRDRAIVRASNDSLDMTVYASLIRAYHTCELEETGLHFYNKVLQSFAGAQDEELLTANLRASLVLHTLIPHHVANNNFAAALKSVSAYELSPISRDLARAKICISAADAGDADCAQAAFSAISAANTDPLPLMALVAMHVRHGRITDASDLVRQGLSSGTQITSVDFATMYVASMLRNGLVEEGLMQARKMFEQIRGAATQAGERNAVMDDIDEAIVLFGETLAQQHAVISSQDSIYLIRIMIENGGLVSPVAQHAIANLGPDCIHQLSPQDIALALHVQAAMVPSWGEGPDVAHGARFSHLLETVLNRGIPMDPSTVNVVSDALPKLNGSRPDLVQRWQELLQPLPKLPPTPLVFSPVVTPSPIVEMAPLVDSYDPYAYNCDFRTSKIIEDQLESTVGRAENHLSDALSRFRNVRRAGRHLHYRAYAKLITAAGKTKQKNLMHEILSMAQTDVPLLPQYASVKNGWVGILDALVSACLTIGDRQLAAKFHQDLLEMGAAPSANTFGIYITTLEGTFDEATEAVKIFQRALSEGVEPSVFLYNAVIGKLGKARRIDDCLFYFGDMQAKDIRPSSVTYGTLVNALCRTSEERFAEEMFDEMESMPNYRPRAAPYNSIIQYFLNTKRDHRKVLAYYERMKAKNIKPTSHTYKLLIESHASLEPVDLGAAETVLAEMKAAGVQPESVHYGSLIHAKGCVLHDMAGARAAFDAVLADGTVRPTDNLYQNLLESMVANHQVAQTDDVLEDMARRRVQMTPYIANTLIHGWAGEKDIEKAKKIYDGLGRDKREPSTYEAMTRAFLSVEDHASANQVVQEMLGKGYPAAVAEKVCVLVAGGTGT